VLKGLHNRLGESGESLTVLSLLKPLGDDAPLNDTEGDFLEITERLRTLAGDDAEVVDMYSVYPNEGGSLEFLALELVPLRQAIEELRRNARSDDRGRAVLRKVRSSDEIDEPEEPGNQALGHLREAIRKLFNRAGENGEQLTVLSLLSKPSED
jgi:hypothetical protein